MHIATASLAVACLLFRDEDENYLPVTTGGGGGKGLGKA